MREYEYEMRCDVMVATPGSKPDSDFLPPEASVNMPACSYSESESECAGIVSIADDIRRCRRM